MRDHLLEVADRLFYQNGIQAVGVDSIVARSGVAKSTLYRWFPTKDDLVVAFLQYRNRLFWRFWDEVADAHEGATEELFAHLQWIQAYIADPACRGCPFLNTTAEFAGVGEAVRDVCKENKAELQARLRRLAADIGPAHPDDLADQLLLLVDGAFATSQVFGAHGPQGQLEAAGRALISAAKGHGAIVGRASS